MPTSHIVIGANNYLSLKSKGLGSNEEAGCKRHPVSGNVSVVPTTPP